MGHLLNVSLQVFLDVWNEMWLPLTFVMANIHLRIGWVSLNSGKKILEKSKWNNMVIFFLGHPLGDMFHCLNKTQQTVKYTHKLLLPEIKYEWNKGQRLRFPGSVFQPGLINSNTFREVISDDARQAGSYSLLVYYFTLPWAQYLTFTTLKGHKVKFYSQI